MGGIRLCPGWKRNISMIIELEKNVWLADLDEGDPPRTTIKEYAKEFETMESAARVLTKARTFRPFKKAQIHEPALY